MSSMYFMELLLCYKYFHNALFIGWNNWNVYCRKDLYIQFYRLVTSVPECIMSSSMSFRETDPKLRNQLEFKCDSEQNTF
jgi:hypothetical protein